MVIIDNLVPQGSIMPDNLRSDTARASLEYKNQLKNAGDIYVGTGTKITNNEDGSKEIYVTEGKNIQKALNEDIFRVDGKNNIGLTNSNLNGYFNNIGIGKDISIIGNNNILIGNGAKTPISNEYAVIIGDKASSYAGGITIGRNAVSTGTNVVTIGDNANNKAESGIVIGSASATSTAVSGIALGGSARVEAPNAVQIGEGVNSVENSLQFHATQIVGGDGHVNATKINGVLSTDIFENDKKTVKDATNVTGTIGGRDINEIFVGETATVKTAENLTMTVGDPYTPVYFTRGVPGECAIKYYPGRGWDSNNNQVLIPYSDIVQYDDGKKWLLITLPTVSNKVTTTPVAGGAAVTASNNIDDIKVVQGTVNHHLLSLPDQTKRSFAVIGVAGKTYTITVNSQGVLIEGPNDKDQNNFYKYTFPYVMVQFIKDSWQYSST